jgi:YcxB-like protein
MSEQTSREMQATINLRSSDYLTYQLWYVRHALRYRAVAYSIFAAVFAVIVGVVGSASQWIAYLIIYVLVLMAGLGLVAVMPFIRTGLAWCLGRLPSKMQISMDAAGFTVTMTDHNVRTPWSDLVSITQNRSAYYLMFNYLHSLIYFVRIPKRELTPDQAATFELIVRAAVPATVHHDMG